MIHFKDVFVVQKSRQLLSQQRVGKDALGLVEPEERGFWKPPGPSSVRKTWGLLMGSRGG